MGAVVAGADQRGDDAVAAHQLAQGGEGGLLVGQHRQAERAVVADRVGHRGGHEVVHGVVPDDLEQGGDLVQGGAEVPVEEVLDAGTGSEGR